MRVKPSTFTFFCFLFAVSSGCSDDAGRARNSAANVDDSGSHDAAVVDAAISTSPLDTPTADAPNVGDVALLATDASGPVPDAASEPDLLQSLDEAMRNWNWLHWSIGDLATNVGPNDIYLESNFAAFTVPPAEFEQFASQIALFTWPELEPIPFTTVVRAVVTYPNLPRIQVQFTLPATTPRWYLAQVTLNERFRMLVNPAIDYLPYGASDGGASPTVGVRFMTASHPCVHGIEEIAVSGSLGSDAGGDWELSVVFSEAVDVSVLMPNLQLAEPARSVCNMVQLLPDNLPTGTSVIYNCTQSVIRGLSFSLNSSTLLNGPTLTVPPDGPFYDNLGSGVVYRYDLTKL